MSVAFIAQEMGLDMGSIVWLPEKEDLKGAQITNGPVMLVCVKAFIDCGEVLQVPGGLGCAQ